MDKSGKVTMELVCRIIAALAALLGIMFMIWLEFRRSMIAVVDGGHWKAPKTVVTELKAVEVNKIKAMDPNRMTAEDAFKTCSLYVINIRNRGKNKTQNTQISMPKALHWEVTWESDQGKQTKNRSNTTLMTLPDIPCERYVDVKVWAACDSTRSHAKEVEITQGYGYSARKDIRTPVWSSVLYLSPRMSKVVKIYVIILFSGFLTLIYILMRRRYFPRKQ